MLISITTQNFKAYKDGFNFSMQSTGIHQNSQSLLAVDVGRRHLGISPVSIIYGDNGAGKTTILQSLDILQGIIRRGHVSLYGNEIDLYPKYANPCLVPYVFSENEPTLIEVVFKGSYGVYKYSLKFLQESAFHDWNKKAESRIISEQLFIDGSSLFLREEDNRIVIKQPYKFSKFYGRNANLGIEFAEIKDDDLFLNYFCKLISPVLGDDILHWFFDTLKISGGNFGFSPKAEDETQDYVHSDFMSGVYGAFSCPEKRILFKKDAEGNYSIPIVSMTNNAGEEVMVNGSVFESTGVLKVLKMSPAFLMALQNGYVLMLDEIENSLSVNTIRCLVELFQNSEINKFGAQLIFTSHNPFYLRTTQGSGPASEIRRLFRKDEIKYAYKGEGKDYSLLTTMRQTQKRQNADLTSEKVLREMRLTTNENILLKPFADALNKKK